MNIKVYFSLFFSIYDYKTMINLVYTVYLPYMPRYFRNQDYYRNIFAEICIRKSGKTDKKLIERGTSIAAC